MNKDLELCVEYKNRRKLFILEHFMTFDDFKKNLQKEFKLQSNHFKLLDIKRKAELISIKSFKEENDVQIVIEENEAEKNQYHSLQQSDSNIEISKEVEYTDLLGKIFTAEMLDADLNVWANKIEFHLIYCEGKQNLKKKVSKELSNVM